MLKLRKEIRPDNVVDKKVQKRLTLLILVLALFFLILLGRLAYLQILKGEKYFKIANFNIIRTTYVPAPRGVIRDRKGRILATDVPRLNICAIPSEIQDINIFCKKLAPLLEYPPSRIRKIVKQKGINPYQKVVIKAKVNNETMMRVAEVQPDIPGLHLEIQPVREYPNGKTASHVIGYVGEITEEQLKSLKSQGYKIGDYIGKDGIEKQYDRYLKGKHGERKVIVDAAGRIIRTIVETKPAPGNNVNLTIDVDLQFDVEKILKWHVKSLSTVSREPLAASAIIENTKTGEILAIASIPQFDPNKFSKGISAKEYKKLVERKDYPLLNRAVAGGYPLASTFKMITATAALEENIITRYSPFYCPGYYKVGDHRFNCFVRTGHGKIDFSEAMSESCDVAFYFMGEKLGIDRLLKYSRDFGLGRKTGIDLPAESPGVLPNHYWKLRHFKEPWYTGDTVNLSIGQGYLSATPIQLALVTTAIANNGKVLRPKLLKSMTNDNGRTIHYEKPHLIRRVSAHKRHLNAIRDGMIKAVTDGTAKRLKCPVSAGGKTGTAESFPCPENPNGRNHTWFTCFSPAYDPEITVVVLFERSGGLASKRVVPIAGEILNAYYKHYPIDR